MGFKLHQFDGRVAVFDSVPDALKFLLGTPWFWRLLGRKTMTPAEQRAWIEGMARAKLNEWAADFVAKMGPDRLDAAMAERGFAGCRGAAPCAAEGRTANILRQFCATYTPSLHAPFCAEVHLAATVGAEEKPATSMLLYGAVRED